MKESKADVLLHPVRLRIVQALLPHRELTAQEIGKILSDVPQATLYRHLNKLLEAGFIEVVHERPVGGAIERVYAASQGQLVINADGVAGATPEDHNRFFSAFCFSLMHQFAEYLKKDGFDLEKDRVGYRTLSMYLSDGEFDELMQQIRDLFQTALSHPPTAERRRRQISLISILDDTPGERKEAE